MRIALSGKSFAAVVGVGAAAIVLATVVIYIGKTSDAYKLSPALKQQITSFNAFYPTDKSLPAGYALKRESAHVQAETFLFSVSVPGGGTMHISEQPVPEEFLHTQSFIGKDSIETPLGAAAISYIGQRTSAFLITKDRTTLIIASTNDPVDKDQVRAVLAGLRKQ